MGTNQTFIYIFVYLWKNNALDVVYIYRTDYGVMAVGTELMKSSEERLVDHIVIILLLILKDKDIMREKYVSEWKTFAKCNVCWEFKEATTENFYVKKGNELWITTSCKLCSKKYHHERYLKNKNEILVATNKYYHSHRDLYLENYKNKREKRLEYAKKYREEHSDRILEYRERNKERFSQKNIEQWAYIK